jgi:hypothetical protein
VSAVLELELEPRLAACELTIAGVSVPLAEVLAVLTIRHGRAEPDDAPTSSTLQTTMTAWASERVRCGDELAFTVDGAPRFVGQVSDLAVSFPAGVPRLELTAAGSLARIARRKIGYSDWPAELWQDRASRIMAEAGWSAYVLDPPDASDLLMMAPRAAGETTVTAMLADLATTGAACICDMPDGSILLQPLSARHAAASVLELAPELVAFAPTWRQALDVVNLAVVAYGPLEDSHTITTRNASSVNTYGERSTELATTFDSSDDAASRGLQLVTRCSAPRWLVDSASLLGLPTALRVGELVQLTELPPGSPVGSSFGAALEGWAETLAGEDWTTILALSDPARSGLTIEWRSLPPELAWQDVDPTCSWETAYSSDDLEG